MGRNVMYKRRKREEKNVSGEGTPSSPHPERSERSSPPFPRSPVPSFHPTALPPYFTHARRHPRNHSRPPHPALGARLPGFALWRARRPARQHLVDPHRGVVGYSRVAESRSRATRPTARAAGAEAGLAGSSPPGVEHLPQPAEKPGRRDRAAPIGGGRSARGAEEAKADQAKPGSQGGAVGGEAPAGPHQTTSSHSNPRGVSI
jgi:hypothetical protein